MLKLLLYLTPQKYANAFSAYSVNENFKQLRIISLLGLTMSVLARLVGLYYAGNYRINPSYAEVSNANWLAMAGHSLFFLISFVGKKHGRYRSIASLVFMVFVLTLGLYFSYVVSMHNTKNTLMMLLLSIFVVAVFFVIERGYILVVSTTLFLSFCLSIVWGEITFYEKTLNLAAGLMLSALLLIISRYNYYLRSQNFVKLKLLEEKNREIAILSNQKNDVLAYVVHDLRSPLANIEMLNEFILTEQPQLQEAQLIKQSTDQANHIINDLLDALRLDSKDENNPVVELNDLLLRLVAKWVQSSERKVNYVPVSACNVSCNPSKLERVFENIYQNAHKFSPLDKPIDIDVELHPKCAKIHIRDYGVGIPSNLLSCLFDQFTPASRKGLRGEKSTGIGLHISKKIVEQYQGSLSVSSKENEGSTFTIELMLAG
jgi:signal transduction histidine kinase